MARAKVWLALSCSVTNRGFTPHTNCSCRATCLSLVIARIGVLGRNLLTLRAVDPDLVRGRIAAALSWRPMLLTAWQIALEMLEAMWLSSTRWG